MSFRDDGDALRNRVDALEDELARAKDEAERLRAERDLALAPPRWPPAELVSGAKVWVEWRGTWWKATVLHPLQNGGARIHYDGWSASWDESVGPERIAPGAHAPPGRRGRATGPLGCALVLLVMVVALASIIIESRGVDPPPGVVVSSSTELAVGAPVWIEWSGSWYIGNVLAINSGTSVRVHYDGFSDTFDEIVTLDRLRLR